MEMLFLGHDYPRLQSQGRGQLREFGDRANGTIQKVKTNLVTNLPETTTESSEYAKSSKSHHISRGSL
jgi:hypothetical protein